MRIKRILKHTAKIFALGLILLIGTIVFVNSYVKRFAQKYILTAEEAQEIGENDCIIVLGAAVRDGVRPSAMLNDRLQTGIALYKNGVSPKIIMSGDHGRKE